jgi:hypothetical protein
MKPQKNQKKPTGLCFFKKPAIFPTLRIPDPDFTYPGSRISDPGSKNSSKREG